MDGEVIEIGQPGGGEDFEQTLDKIACLQRGGLKTLKIHLEGSTARRDDIHAGVKDALLACLQRANSAIDVQIRAEPLPLTESQIKVWEFQDFMDDLLGVIAENPLLSVRSLDFRGCISPTHEVLVTFVRAKHRHLIRLVMVEAGVDAIQGGTVLYGRENFDFCVSPAFLPKLLDIPERQRGPVTLDDIHQVDLPLLRFLLTKRSRVVSLGGMLNFTDLVEASRRNSLTRKLTLLGGSVRAKTPSPVLVWEDVPPPTAYVDGSELVLRQTRIDGNLDFFFDLCRNYEKVKLDSCRLEPSDDTVDSAAVFPKLPCPSLTLDLGGRTCWPLLHRVLETQTVLDLTLVFPDTPDRVEHDFTRFRRNLADSNIRNLTIAFGDFFMVMIPPFLESVADMKHLETFSFRRAMDLSTGLILPSHAKYLLAAVKRNRSLRHVNIGYFDDREGEDSTPVLDQLSYQIALNRMRFHKLMPASEDTMALTAWPFALARTARFDGSTLYSMLQNKLPHIVAHARECKRDHHIPGTLGKVYDCPRNKHYLCDRYLAYILWYSFISRAAVIVITFLLVTVVMKRITNCST